MQKKNVITFRLDEMEEAQLKQVAEEIGLTVSQYIRKRINQEPIIKVYQPRELLQQINGIGNNINQIARHANTCDSISADQIEQIRQDVSHLKWQLYEFLGEADVLCRS